MKWKEAKELETIEKDIAGADKEMVRIEAIFSSHDFYEKYGNQITELTAELAAAKQKVDILYKRWHELEELKTGGEGKRGEP